MKVSVSHAGYALAFDNGGRRSGLDRRMFSYTGHIPERRSGLERRNCADRRNFAGDPIESERRACFSDCDNYAKIRM
jgi:hypothetical protein